MKKFLFLLFVLISFSIESQERFNNQMLNGEWEIIYDENNDGKKNKYHSNDGFDNGMIEKIYVPSVWERYKKDYEGVVYYRRKFKVPKSEENKKIHLIGLVSDGGVHSHINHLKGLSSMIKNESCLLYTSPSPRDNRVSRMPSSA